ncbi:hypothetical protein AB3X52_13925 [Nocardioides sp. DS6]|uniref:Uncharacterized protein n=1 Tax=Nocardioides eburneus TaxID=3231482 RepID=A0ABV3T0J8_9ACTN
MTHYTAEQIEAVQHVVERVGANWDAATEGTVEEALRAALPEAGVEVDDGDVVALAHAIEEQRGTVSAAEVLRVG